MHKTLKKNYPLQKLLNQYHKFGSLIVAYDFDDTVCDYQTHEPIFENIKLLQELKPYCKFMCYTAHTDSELIEIRKFLKDNDIPFDTINEQIGDRFFGNKKLYFNVLLDDKVGIREVRKTLKNFLKKVKKEK